jgi:2-polyprenyl-3-methyl-5-hydroxy-6-metoxy-1,4-benzoquinol methylase
LLNYDNLNNQYNLDDEWSSSDKYKNIKKFDFILCSQVLEHIYSPSQALKNLKYITKTNGYIWVSIPTINCIHGEPYFYSSGYHPRYLTRLAKQVGLECLHIGAWGNKKYLASAVLGKWLNHDQLKPSLNKIQEFFKIDALKDGRLNDLTGNYITDTWALLKNSMYD